MLIQKLAVLFILVLSLSFLLNSRSWVTYTKDVISAPVKGIPFSVIMLTMGLVVVLSSHEMMPDYSIGITLIGWFMLFYGAIMLVYPGFIEMFGTLSDAMIKRNLLISGTILSITSVYLVYRMFI